jgi:hypothetical protein
MDRLKQVPHITLELAKPIEFCPKMIDIGVKLEKGESYADKFLLALLNKYGVDITKDNASDFVGLIEICELPPYEEHVRNFLVEYKGKPLCGYQRITGMQEIPSGFKYCTRLIECKDIVVGKKPKTHKITFKGKVTDLHT